MTLLVKENCIEIVLWAQKYSHLCLWNRGYPTRWYWYVTHCYFKCRLASESWRNHWRKNSMTKCFHVLKSSCLSVHRLHMWFSRWQKQASNKKKKKELFFFSPLLLPAVVLEDESGEPLRASVNSERLLKSPISGSFCVRVGNRSEK